MLGDKIGTLTGRLMSQRFRPAVNGHASFEATVDMTGTINAIPVTMGATYSGVVHDGGWFEAENLGANLTVTSDGDSGVWRGWATGRFTGPRGINASGFIYYTSGTGKLALLVGRSIVFDYSADEDGNVTFDLTAWEC